MLIDYLDIDNDVNVFVCGDIHGEYDQLMEELNKIGFNFEEDLLIGVADLVDRSSDSLKCVSLLDKKWFKTVMGNHEDFCIQGLYDDRVAFYHKMPNNGGQWFYELDEVTQQNIVERFKQLPILMEVKYRGKKFGFVHADLPYEDWELVKECLINNDIIDGRNIVDHLLWSRGIVNSRSPVYVAGIDNVFFGHTVLDKVTQIGNCTFLDTGGCFKHLGNKYKISVVKLEDYC